MAEADEAGSAGSDDEDATAGAVAAPFAGLVGPDGDPDSLAGLAAGTFHVALLVVAVVAALQTAGVLGDALAGFGTLPGAAVYLVLWAIGWWTTRRAIVEVVRRARDGRGRVAAAVVAGTKWGAVAASGFLLAVGVPGALVLVLTAPAEVLAVVLIGGIGIVVAALVGSAVGGVLALLDVALLGVAVRVAVPGGDER